MKKENDEITDLFRTRLADAGMSVRDGFWEELSQEIPVACQHRRRILLFRVAAAASVLLVLAASSATFLYFSPKEEMEEAFTKIAVTNGGQMDGDGIRVNQLPLPVEPVLPKPAPKSYGMLSQYTEEEDSLSITFSMSFSFSSTTSTGNGNRYGNQGHNGYWQATNGNTGSSVASEEQSNVDMSQPKAVKKHRWAMKVQVGTALPADNGTYKMPVSAGVTVERKLNDFLGIETGLLYSNLRSAGQHLHYLGIPVKVNVTLVDTKKIDLYATVGGVADKCIAGAPDNSFKEEPIQLAVTAGIGINYKINDRLAVFAEPGASHDVLILMKMKKTLLMLWMAVCLIVSFTGCTSEEMDYNNPDVALFVKQLKSGTYKMKNEKGVVEVPHFTEEDIPELLKYAEDLTIIPSFPSVYNMNNGKIRLGECMLWVIESIRQGTPPSLGCKMVLANAENYEAIYFLTDEEVLDAAACYRSWWEERQYPKTRWTIDPCYDEPLCGSGYRWW